MTTNPAFVDISLLGVKTSEILAVGLLAYASGLAASEKTLRWAKRVLHTNM